MTKPLVIAHRGYSAKFPENTIRAFKEAIACKAPAIELDVHLSKDHELVVTHDFKFGRTVKSTGCVSDFTTAELAKMDAGSFKGDDFKAERVSKLSEIVEIINHHCLLNVEIKEETLVSQSAYEMMVDKLLLLLKPYGLKDILFSSFDPYALKTLRAKSTEARMAYLDDCADQGPKIELAKGMNAEAYNLNLKRVTYEQVCKIKAAGLKVNAYTVKNATDLELARGLQVDGIFADNLEEALKFFE